MIDDGERSQRPGLYAAGCGRGVDEGNLHGANEQVVDHAGRARLVRDRCHHKAACATGKERHVVVYIIADTGRTVVDLARMLSRVGYQLRQGLRLEIPCGRDENAWNVDEAHHRHYVPLVSERKLASMK